MVEVGDVDDSIIVVFQTESDLLCVLPALTTAAAMESMLASMKDIEHVAKKLFRSNHGHDYSSVCDSCDPEAMKRIRERRRKQSK